MTKDASAENKADVAEYRDSAFRLLEDLDHASRYLEFQVNGGRILQAVDFSEIHAFASPSDDFKGFELFPGLTPSDLTSLHLATLNGLFFGLGHEEEFADPVPLLPPKRPIVLLPPHRLELRNAQISFQQQSIRRLRAALGQLSDLEIDDKFRILERNLVEAEHDPTVANEINEFIVEYLNHSASDLMLFLLDRKGQAPHARLRQLLERGRIVDLADQGILGRTIVPKDLSSYLVNQLSSKIYDKRARHLELVKVSQQELAKLQSTMKARSHLDALAVAYVVRVNDLIVQRDTDRPSRRLVLITRSNTVLSSVAELSRETEEPRLQLFFQHPRVISTLLFQHERGAEETLEGLQQWRRSLELALRGLDTSADKKPKLISTMAELRELFRKAVNLVVASSDWDLSIPTKVEQIDIGGILTLLRDRHQLHTAIDEAAREVSADINLTNALIARLYPTDSRPSVDTAIEDSTGRRKRNLAAVFIWSKNRSQTLGLYFYNTIIRKNSRNSNGERALERFLKINRANIAELKSEDNAVSSNSLLVESCLASSFLEALVDRWDVAFRFADLAANWPEDLDSTPKHEAYYMRAVCRRRAADPATETERQLQKGLEDLDHALEDRRRAEQDATLEDARYLFERGVHLFNWWERIERRKGWEDKTAPEQMESKTAEAGKDNPRYTVNQSTRLAEAMRLFEEAKSVLDSERQQLNRRKLPDSLGRQILDVANARCYVRVEAGLIDDITFRRFVELREAMIACGWNFETVPISHLDTMFWALFLMRDRLQDIETLKNLARVLSKRLSEHPRPRLDWLNSVVKHLRTVDAELKLGLALSDLGIEIQD